MDIPFICLNCGGTYSTDQHKGCDYCEPDCHYDFCKDCMKSIVQKFEAQMRRRELPKPRLRVEDDEGRLM